MLVDKMIFFSIQIGNKCQFWINKRSRVLTSPYFGGDKQYYNKLNCVWMLKAEHGYYVNFEIEVFKVKNNTYSKMIPMIFSK